MSLEVRTEEERILNNLQREAQAFRARRSANPGASASVPTTPLPERRYAPRIVPQPRPKLQALALDPTLPAIIQPPVQVTPVESQVRGRFNEARRIPRYRGRPRR